MQNCPRQLAMQSCVLYSFVRCEIEKKKKKIDTFNYSDLFKISEKYKTSQHSDKEFSYRHILWLFSSWICNKLLFWQIIKKHFSSPLLGLSLLLLLLLFTGLFHFLDQWIWRNHINRIDPVSNILWKPGTKSMMYSDHFEVGFKCPINRLGYDGAEKNVETLFPDHFPSKRRKLVYKNRAEHDGQVHPDFFTITR